jgi:hypothetical protein
VKGQYLALESVLTFGLGLMAAVGIIGAFDSYSRGVYDTSEKVEADIIAERVLNNVNSLRPVEGEAYREVNLPEDISNRDYTVLFGQNLTIDVEGEEYVSRIPMEENFEGSGSGQVRIYRTNNGFELVDT